MDQSSAAPGKVYPFEEIPSGVDLARYFWEHTDHTNPGYDGIDLWRDGEDYCYLWVHSMVDFDFNVFYLLDVRTSVGGEETRDSLFLHVGPFSKLDVEWRQKPVAFQDATMYDVYDSLQWFINKVKAAT
jgi:hypothetical protein